jgi:cell division septal protein FtsQ
MIRRRLLIWGGLTAAAVLAAVVVPLGLRQLGFFRVRQIELVGLHYLSPHDVLGRLALERARNVFDPLADLVARAESIPGVLGVDVDRRLPGTLRLTLTEEPPVAFARGADGLVPLDATSRPLPYDPARSGFDVPLVERPDSGLTRVLDLIRQIDPPLFEEIVGVRRGRGESVILELGDRRVWLEATAGAHDIRELETVRRHLERHGVPYRELDARFDGWVVVRRERV